MKYFFDTEFLEGKQDKTLFGLKYGETKPTIDLISIGIVAEDGREYYAISKDFNIDEAWNRHCNSDWITDNVLRPIYEELLYSGHLQAGIDFPGISPDEFTLKNLKKLIKAYGKTNNQIAEEIKIFAYNPKSVRPTVAEASIEFYAYYADYDWVVFCQLFGTMMDLPVFFPMYCKDLKQILDKKASTLTDFESFNSGHHTNMSFYRGLKEMKLLESYPKQENEHNALADARWNVELYKFLNSQKQ